MSILFYSGTPPCYCYCSQASLAICSKYTCNIWE